MTAPEHRLFAAADAARDELVALAQDLVRLPSENLPPGGNELACQRRIERFMRQEGLAVDVFTPDEAGIAAHPAYFPGRTYRDRPNVVGTLAGRGGGKSLIFSSHADTVPVGPREKWELDPCSGALRDGRLYGRGSFDMKGGLAASLMAVALLKRLDVPLRGEIKVESVVDEEFAGGHGTLAARLRGHRADAAVVPENSGMTIYHMHRGLWIVHLTVRGTGGIDFNAEADPADNPIEHVGRLVAMMSGYRAVRRARAKVPPAYAYLQDASPVLLTKLGSGDLGPTAPIAVPDAVVLEVYVQLMPGETREEIEAEFLGYLEPLLAQDSFFKEHPLERSHPYRFMPGSGVPADHPLVTQARACASTVTGREIPARAAPYPCDLYLFNELFGIPGILLGPRGDHAHAPNEYVLVDDLLAVTKTFLLLAARWAG